MVLWELKSRVDIELINLGPPFSLSLLSIETEVLPNLIDEHLGTVYLFLFLLIGRRFYKIHEKLLPPLLLHIEC